MKKILFFLLLAIFSSQAFATKYVALTFDDWPSPKTTPQVLQILKKNHVKATFFVLWKNANKSPDILKAMIQDWHEIWNHSYSHPWLTKIPFKEAKKELSSTNIIIKDNAWVDSTFRRPPGWYRNNQIQKQVWMKLAMRTIDTKDRKHKNPAKTLENIKANLKPWAIILMHDIHPTSVQALPSVIDYVKSQWYTFVTLDELSKISPSSFNAKNTLWEIYRIDEINQNNSIDSSESISSLEPESWIYHLENEYSLQPQWFSTILNIFKLKTA